MMSHREAGESVRRNFRFGAQHVTVDCFDNSEIFTQQNARFTTLCCLSVVIVAGLLDDVFDILVTRLVVHMGGRLLHADINYGIVVHIAGIVVSAALSRYVDWNMALAVGIALTGPSMASRAAATTIRD